MSNADCVTRPDL